MSNNEKGDDRTSKRGFKKSLDMDTSRHQREAISVQIRKEQQAKVLADKRHDDIQNNNNNSQFHLISTKADMNMMEQQRVLCQNIDNVCNHLAKLSEQMKLFGADTTPEKTEYMRMMTETFIGLDDILVEGGQSAENHLMKNNILGCIASYLFFPMPSYAMITSLLGLLVDITSGKMGEVKEIMRFNIVPYLVGLMKIDKDKLLHVDTATLECYLSMASYVMHILSNMMLDSEEARKYVLDQKALEIATETVIKSNIATTDITRAYIRMINCVLRIKPLPEYRLVEDIVSVFDMLRFTEDTVVMELMLSSYYHILSSGEKDCAMLFVNNRERLDFLCDHLLNVIEDPSKFESSQWYAVRMFALQALVELLYADELCIQLLVRKNIIPIMCRLVTHTLIQINCHALLTLAVIADKDRERAEQMLSLDVLTDNTLSNMRTIDNYKTHRYFIMMLRNILEAVDDKTVVSIFCSDIVCKKVVDGLRAQNPALVVTAIGCARVALECSEGESLLHDKQDKIRERMEKYDIFRKLEECEASRTKDVSDEAQGVLERFFSEKRHEEKEAMSNGGKPTASEFKFEPLDPQEGLIFGDKPEEARAKIFGGLAAMIGNSSVSDNNDNNDMKD